MASLEEFLDKNTRSKCLRAGRFGLIRICFVFIQYVTRRQVKIGLLKIKCTSTINYNVEHQLDHRNMAERVNVKSISPLKLLFLIITACIASQYNNFLYERVCKINEHMCICLCNKGSCSETVCTLQSVRKQHNRFPIGSIFILITHMPDYTYTRFDLDEAGELI